MPGDDQTAQFWAGQAARLGLVKALIPEADRESESGRARGMGVVLTAHRDETFEVETENDRLSLKLKKSRRRHEPGQQPSTRYGFEIVAKSPIPADEDLQG